MSSNYQQESFEDNVYVNIDFAHADPTYSEVPSFHSVNNAPIPLEFDVTKTANIVDNAYEYYVSVIRANIPLTAIPKFVCPIVPNQGNPALTPFVIGIAYAGGTFQQNLIFSSNVNNQPLPVQNTNRLIVTPALFVYNLQALINMMNAALYAACVAAGIFPFPVNTTRTPWFYWNSTLGSISLTVPSYFVFPLQSGLTAIPTIFINNQLKQYINNFDYFFEGYSRVGNDDWYFNLYAVNPSANVYYPAQQQAYYLPGTDPTTLTPPAYWNYDQKFNSTNLITAIANIIVTTNTLPIKKENVPSISTANGQNNLLPILIDFGTTSQTAGDVYFNYAPESQYRLTDMQTSTRINTIDLRVFWQDLYGNYWPMLINPYQHANIKIAFIKKKLYKLDLKM